MRFASAVAGGIRVFAVTGTNTVSFGIDANAASRAGLLGFAVERIDPAKNERYFVHGFKVFRERRAARRTRTTVVSTFEHPIQSLVWDDFTGGRGDRTRYEFHPLAGDAEEPRPLAARRRDRRRRPSRSTARAAHDVFFNRGVASSQAYARRFGNLPPDQQPTAAEAQEGPRLAQPRPRRRDAAVHPVRPSGRCDPRMLLRVHLPTGARRAQEGHRPGRRRAARHRPQGQRAHEQREAARRHDQGGVPRQRSPAREPARDPGRRAPRIGDHRARGAAVEHRAQQVHGAADRRGPATPKPGLDRVDEPHRRRHPRPGQRRALDPRRAVARSFLDYWTLLDQRSRRAGRGLRLHVRSPRTPRSTRRRMSPTPRTRFPRSDAHPGRDRRPCSVRASGLAPLDLYVALAATSAGAGLHDLRVHRARAVQGRARRQHPGRAALLPAAREGGPRRLEDSTTPFVRLQRGATTCTRRRAPRLETPLGQWVVETDNRKLGLNSHVAFMHCKFLLHDPLGADPIVVTGSANFSVASTKATTRTW